MEIYVCNGWWDFNQTGIFINKLGFQHSCDPVQEWTNWIHKVRTWVVPSHKKNTASFWVVPHLIGVIPLLDHGFLPGMFNIRNKIEHDILTKQTKHLHDRHICFGCGKTNDASWCLKHSCFPGMIQLKTPTKYCLSFLFFTQCSHGSHNWIFPSLFQVGNYDEDYMGYLA